MRQLIAYGSLSNTSQRFAKDIQLPSGTTTCKDFTQLDLDELFLAPPQVLLLCLSSYNVETPLDSAIAQWEEAANDFRVGSGALAKTYFAVLGIGHSSWSVKDYQCMAKKMDHILESLGAKRFRALSFVDTASDPEADFEIWKKAVLSLTRSETSLEEAASLLQSFDDVYESAQEDLSSAEEEGGLTPAQVKFRQAKRKAKLRSSGPTSGDDIEDLGASMSALKSAVQERDAPEPEAKEMLSSLTRKALTKQGYRLVGSHSGVKTCRWTKAALRKRGFCYKHAFYGIMSHRCMETTPSLACANKCTFCWRSHTNPVGTSWRWKTDKPEFVVNEALAQHDSLIKQLKGLPELDAERFEEARTPRHAALSLVGEPIMYPHIREYIQLLHSKHISTFLVTNAQFPEPMKTMPPVTQLYLSIDAGDKVSLKAVDRPLHRDYWERLLDCVGQLATKEYRTVFRLTLVKEANDEELQGYVDLIKRGKPDFLEVKGVTFCGYGGSSGLSIKNSPFHEEVVRFVQLLVEELDKDVETRGRYALASEHAHSCCVLAASTDFLRDGVWHTWIDYDRFFELIESGAPFKATDYCCPTPAWAHFGAPEAGFSPEDERFYRKQRPGQIDS